MEALVRKLQHDYPAYTFGIGAALCWSPAAGQIFYEATERRHSASGLLHELAHAILDHKSYQNDLDLLHKEVAAWDKAVELAQHYGRTIDQEHIQDCIDTYRDWLHKRSTCPICRLAGIQQTAQQYTCLNCSQTWTVSSARFARPYRLKEPAAQKN